MKPGRLFCSVVRTKKIPLERGRLTPQSESIRQEGLKAVAQPPPDLRVLGTNASRSGNRHGNSAWELVGTLLIAADALFPSWFPPLQDTVPCLLKPSDRSVIAQRCPACEQRATSPEGAKTRPWSIITPPLRGSRQGAAEPVGGDGRSA